jgi:CubicO group peptidase (beta-lactamase class C family)
MSDRSASRVGLWLALTIPAVFGVASARAGQTPGAVQPQPAGDTAVRVERVLKGLRPRIEVEGAPVRWTLAERMAVYKVPAVSIAIIDGGRVVWAQGFGVTEVGGRDPVTGTTLFQAGSISKPIAVSAMLRLVDRGTLSLDANVNRYLTSWKLPENELTSQEPVTLRRLATHTAGTTVSGFPGYAVGAPRPTVPELLDGKAPANTAPVRVDTLPGQAFRYSGGGITIMQQVLIDVSGMPFPALLQQQVLGPIGMVHSSFEQPLSAARAADAARGHEKGVVVPGGWHVYPELAAAGLWTTPTDVAAWTVAMADALAGRSTAFLSRPTAAQVVASTVPGRTAQERVGPGLFFNGRGDSLSFGHGGQDEGFVSDLKMYLEIGKGAVIMVNSGAGVGLIREIELAIEAEFGWPETGTTRITTVAVDPLVLERLTGTYVLYNLAGRHFPRVLREGTRLFYEFGAARNEMYPQSPATFIGADGTRFAFARDESGRDVLILGTGANAVAAVKQ